MISIDEWDIALNIFNISKLIILGPRLAPPAPRDTRCAAGACTLRLGRYLGGDRQEQVMRTS